MPLTLDKTAVGRSFGRAAAQYDRWAESQRRIADHLDRLLPHLPPPATVLEWGCGTGYFTSHFRERFPDASTLGVDISDAMIAMCRDKWPNVPKLQFLAADAETFRPAARVELIAASSCTQWFSGPETVAVAADESLIPGGHVALAAPVAGSLPELHCVHQRVTGFELPGLPYCPAEAYRSAFEALGFKILHFSERAETTWRPDAWSVLHSLKGIGATFSQQPDYRPLPHHLLREVVRNYERCYANSNHGVPLTYQVVYLLAQKPGSGHTD